MCTERITGWTSTASTIPEAREAYQDLDGLHDGKFVNMHVRGLFALRSQAHDGGGDMLDDVWAYLLTTREQLAFQAYLCVRKGVCESRNLHLERFEDQEVDIADTLLLSVYEPAIALSPITSRVRRIQLAVLTSGFWDALELSTIVREDHLMLLG